MCLITTATGTVGRPLLAELRGHAVRAVTRDPSRLPGAVSEPDVTRARTFAEWVADHAEYFR